MEGVPVNVSFPLEKIISHLAAARCHLLGLLTLAKLRQRECVSVASHAATAGYSFYMVMAAT